MRRRDAIPTLLLGAPALALSLPPASLDPYLNGAQGAAVLLDVQSRTLLGICNQKVADSMPGLPGSTIKPLALASLLRLGRLTAHDAYACPGRLTIAGHQLNCSHPPMAEPMRLDTALAYSCNCYTAHFAARFRPGELAADLTRAGLADPNGHVSPARTPDAIRLQALGEDSLRITLTGLTMAYRALALHSDPAILAGLEGAVDYGTAQLAAVPGLKLAGKTGSTGAAETRLAWFAGFAPSRSPRVVCAILLHGHSGGADAAPIAARILTAWKESHQ